MVNSSGGFLSGWIISTNVIVFSGVSSLLSRSIQRSLTQWQACLWKSTLNNCLSWAELKCGLGSLTPTCCLPTLRSYGGPPHFVVLTAGTCIPGIAVYKVSTAVRYLCLLIYVSLSLSPSLLAQTFLALLPRDKRKQERGQRRERRKVPYQRRMKEKRDQRRRQTQQGRDEVCLGYFGFLRSLCGVNILSLLSWLPA